MSRKPNYAFERNNRAKAKAAKREAKRQAKLASKSQASDTEMPDDNIEQAIESREGEVPGPPRSNTPSESS